jgi:addiction module HigA family antidote
MPTIGGGDDFVWIGGPDEGFWLLVVVGDEAIDGGLEIDDAFEDAALPGEFLAEILAELGVSQAAFARAIGVAAMRVSHVIAGSWSVTAELAVLFGKAFGQSLEYDIP